MLHVHNTFPLLSPSVLLAARDAAVPVVVTIHNYKLLCASGDFFRSGSICHDCAGGRLLPAVRARCYRGLTVATVPVVAGSAVNRVVGRQSLVSAYVFISAAQHDLMQALALASARARQTQLRPRARRLAQAGDGATVPTLRRALDEARARRS